MPTRKQPRPRRPIVAPNPDGMHHGLCYRCEHRARFLDGQANGQANPPRPRMECGDNSAKSVCYMFQPCRPLVLAKAYKDDHRPVCAGAMLSARSAVVGLADAVQVAVGDDTCYVVTWRVKYATRKKG